MNEPQYKNGDRVHANFNLEDGRLLTGTLDNYDPGCIESGYEATFSILNDWDEQVYAINYSDIIGYAVRPLCAR